MPPRFRRFSVVPTQKRVRESGSSPSSMRPTVSSTLGENVACWREGVVTAPIRMSRPRPSFGDLPQGARGRAGVHEADEV